MVSHECRFRLEWSFCWNSSLGWLPSYKFVASQSISRSWFLDGVHSIAAVLLQIRLAITSTNPPARLAKNWDQYVFPPEADWRDGFLMRLFRPYHPQEALQGYTRAAAIHGWKVRSPTVFIGSLTAACVQVANMKDLEKLVTKSWGSG